MLQEKALSILGERLSGHILSYSGAMETIRGGYERLSELLSADTALLDDRLLNPLAAALQRSLLAAAHLVGCLLSLLLYSSIITLKLLVLVFPHLLRLAHIVVEFHKTQLSVWDMLAEFFIASFLLFVFLFRVRIAQFWSRLQRRLDKRYRVAAKYAPHVTFFLLAAVFSVIGRKILLPICASPAMPLLMIAYPLFQTLQRINRNDSERFCDSLKYWIVAALYFATKMLLALIPFSGFMFQHIYVVQVMVLIVSVWIQVSSTCVDIVFDAVSPMLEYYVNKIPAADFGSQYGSAFLNGLLFARIISPKTAQMLQYLLGDTMSILLCLIFFFTPTYMATFGVAAVVMILPAFKTSKMVGSLTINSPNVDCHGIQTQWMKYWCCFGALIAVECLGVKFWCSILMFMFTWLQHSYFRGASKVFAYVSKEAAAISERHEKLKINKEELEKQQKNLTSKNVDSNCSPCVTAISEESTVSPLVDPSLPQLAYGESSEAMLTPVKNPEEELLLVSNMSDEAEFKSSSLRKRKGGSNSKSKK